jgi:hypothetical protein
MIREIPQQWDLEADVVAIGSCGGDWQLPLPPTIMAPAH